LPTGANREAPGWCRSIFLHILYDSTEVADVRLPEEMPSRRVRPIIGYADTNKPETSTVYTGPVIAPVRIPPDHRSLSAHGATGFMAYSEGVFDDVNKALLAGIASGKFHTADEVLDAYARRYFDGERYDRAEMGNMA